MVGIVASSAAVQKAKELLRAMEANEEVLAQKRAEEERKAQAHRDLIARITRENEEETERITRLDRELLEMQEARIAHWKAQVATESPEQRARKDRNLRMACGF